MVGVVKRSGRLRDEDDELVVGSAFCANIPMFMQHME